MTLFDVVIKNLKYNVRQYFLYIAAMTFSVLIYFTFVSLQHNKQITNALTIQDKLQPLLSTSSFILLLFVLLFIWYSNSFFMNRRKQEIGLYALLGAPRKEIGLMLFYENFVLSIIALVVGIGLGQLFSTFFSMILVKLMGFSMVIQFSFNQLAATQTLFVFLFMTILTSLQGYFIVYRFQLVELFQAKHKGSSLIKPTYLTAVLSLVLIGISYALLLNAAHSNSWEMHFLRNLLLTIGLMIAGSYFLFHSMSGLFIHLLQNKKSIYYKWRNLLTFTQLKSRLKNNAILLTMISVLNGITLVAFGFAYTIYYNTLHTMEDHVPYSYQYEVQDEEVDRQITTVIQNNEDFPLRFEERFDYILADGDAAPLEKIPGGFHFFDEQFAVLPLTTYNGLAKQLERNTLSSIGEDEAVLLGRNFIGSQNKDDNVGHTFALSLSNEEILLTVIGNKTESLFNYTVQPATVIVDDAVYEKLLHEYTPITSHVFKVTDEKQSAALTEKVKMFFPSVEEEPYASPQLHSFSDNYEEAQSIYGLIIFTFGFLSLVFLAATGSIIYFKTLTEAMEDRQRYVTLRKVGMSRRKLKHIIARQTLIIFLLPLIVGITHSSIMLGALANVMDMDFFSPVMICTITYTILYGCYYVMTVVTTNKLVNP